MYARMYKLFYSSFYESLLRGRQSIKYDSILNDSQWQQSEQIKTAQLARLKKLIHHAYANVPYYHDLFDQNRIRPDDINSLEDYARIPVLTKDIIRNADNRLISSKTAGTRIYTTATGGSTGIPLQLKLDHSNYEWRQAAVRRAYGWAGYQEGEKTAFIWGTSVGQISPAKRLKSLLYNTLRRQVYFSTFNLSKSTMPEYARAINDFRPKTIVAYTHSLYNFALFLRDNAINIWQPHAIIAGAEKLFPFQRKVIEDVFGCKVFETYGCREVTSIAAECDRHSGMHINAENIIVEIINDGKPASPEQTGEIVITDLTNFTMPLLRYRNEDIGSLSDAPCACGRGLPLLKSVDGRLLDTIQTPEGKLVSGVFFPHVMKEFPEIEKFQIRQTDVRSIDVAIVRNPDFNDKTANLLKTELQNVLGANMTISFSYVDSIPLTQTGKHRVVVSTIPVSIK